MAAHRQSTLHLRVAAFAQIESPLLARAAPFVALTQDHQDFWVFIEIPA